MTPKGGARPGAGRKPKHGERGVSVAVWLPPKLAEGARDRAEQAGLSRSELVVEALEAYLSDRAILLPADLAAWLKSDAERHGRLPAEHIDRILLEHRARFEARHQDSLRGE
ncbi:MAG: hypothetical protein FJZ01_14800 [Candidatus Sericytochromatia bacterium]|nr:hypothetical protein [Candidatus Tanganyikabacteria bacterium]